MTGEIFLTLRYQLLNRSKVLGLGLIMTAVFTNLGVNILPVHASLIDDTVDCDIVPNGVAWACDPTSALVTDPGSEFTLTLFQNPFFDIDIDDSSITMTNLSSLNAGAGEFVTFSDLDWTNGPGEIIDFSLDVFGVIGLDQSDISFTANSVGIDFNNTSWGLGDSIVVNLETTHTPTPEPSTILSLLTIGGIALGASKKKQA